MMVGTMRDNATQQNKQDGELENKHTLQKWSYQN